MRQSEPQSPARNLSKQSPEPHTLHPATSTNSTEEARQASAASVAVLEAECNVYRQQAEQVNPQP